MLVIVSHHLNKPTFYPITIIIPRVNNTTLKSVAGKSASCPLCAGNIPVAVFQNYGSRALISESVWKPRSHTSLLISHLNFLRTAATDSIFRYTSPAPKLSKNCHTDVRCAKMTHSPHLQISTLCYLHIM